MKLNLSHYIYVFLIIFSFDGFLAQDLSLKISSKLKEDILILKNIEHQQKHKDSVSIWLELEKVANYLKNIGYFTNSLDSVKKEGQNYTGYFSLNEKIDKAVIHVKQDLFYLFDNLKSDSLSIPVQEIETTLLTISKKLDIEGKSFSKIKLRNFIIENKILYANLDINPSKKRYLDRVIVKGYEDFPESFLKNHFNIRKNIVFNQKKIKQLSNSSKSIAFIEEIKPPEVLFTNDSTKLYLYFKKKINNSFDGIVNFASKENGGILFNGNIDLKLNNTLNKGERLELLWNSIAEERQEFKLSTQIPYILNSKFTPDLSFSIYKQDSTFLNTSFKSELYYNINPKANIAITYNTESSELLKGNGINTIETFKNTFLGFRFLYRVPKNDFLFSDKFYLDIHPTFGKRNSNANSSNQFKLKTVTAYIFDLDLRNSFYIKNVTGYLNSSSFLDNELFRIGGANSIRGFNEQSIFTNSYTYFNLEYRYLTSTKSYLYTITDIATFKNNSQSTFLLGIGLGYLFNLEKSQIKLSTIIGKQNSQSLDFNQSKLIINWKTFF